jgi:alkanesulfonate monooxygenase SsuD/methylene tetrahydromethanopterin reductase-like flavin-dependent oxidoreductase (luciferase family)
LTLAGEHYTIEGLNGFPKPAQQPHPPLLIGAGQKRMLRLAGREANTVGILTTSVAKGVLADAPDERLPEAVIQKLAWVREGAGARFETLELSLVPSIVVTDRRRQQTEQFIRDRQWQGISVEQVWAMPSVFIGSIEQICEDMEARRTQYGFSYFVVSDTVMAQFAPVVARLAGR